MKAKFFFVFLAVFLLLTSLPASAQRKMPQPGIMREDGLSMRTVTVRGWVRSGADETGLYRARVTLRAFSGQILGITFTNEEGEFTFNAVPPGNYEVAAEMDGYAPGQQSVQLDNMFGAGGITVFLRPLEGSTPSGGIVSALELALPPKAKKAFEKGLEDLYLKQKPEASLKSFARVTELVPSFYPAYQQSGVAYHRLGRYEEAETSLRKALDLSDGHSVDTMVNLATVLSSRQRFAESEKLSLDALKLSPGNWKANFELARARLGLGRDSEAEKDVQASLQVNAKQPEAYLLLANIHLNRNDRQSLIKDLDNFLHLEPKGPQSDKARAMRDETQKDLAQAKTVSAPAPAKP